MIEFKDTKIRNLAFHKFSTGEQESFKSNAEYEVSKEEEDALNKIFLRPFSVNTSTLEFAHEIDLELNPLFKISRNVLEEENFLADSKDILKHLELVSKHPNIKSGDLFIIKFENIELNKQLYDGLGIYKVETKEDFIETKTGFDNEFQLDLKKGIGSRKLDKACLILFTEEPYTVFVIDNGRNEAEYWRNEFINIAYKKDHVNSTNEFMNLTKSFITEKFPDEYDVSKADQIDLLNRSVDYFKKNEVFDKGEFENQVFKDTEMIASFRSFDDDYSVSNALEIPDSFDISAPVVKKQARVFKSVLKLDKNFHVYIHGNRELIQQGVENDGRKFYKIYFNEES